MELARLTQQTRHHFQFPKPTLGPLNPPRVASAVREGQSNIFMETSGFLVDMEGHSAFCIEAFQGGFLSEADLAPITLYPNGYGLYRVTNRLCERVAERVEIDADRMLHAEQKADLEKALNEKQVDVQYAATIALACTEAGVIAESELAPVMETVTDTGHNLVELVAAKMDALLPIELRSAYLNEPGEQVEVTIGTFIEGDHFYLHALTVTVFHLDLPAKIGDDFLAINILLQKTLHAMSCDLAPFVVPAYAFTSSGQYLYGVGEVYQAIKDKVDCSDMDALTIYLESLDEDSVDCELGYVGLDRFDDEPIDGALIMRAANLMNEMHEADSILGFFIYHHNHDEQLESLLLQARDMLVEETKYRELLNVLVDALEQCIKARATPVHYEESNYPGSLQDGLGFFEAVQVHITDRFPELQDEIFQHIDANAESCESITSALPLANSELVAQVTLPIIDRTRQCLSLLQRITIALRSASHD